MNLCRLKEGWPFFEPMPALHKDSITLLEKIAGRLAIRQLGWEDAMAQLYQYYMQLGDIEEAFKVAEGVTLEHPEHLYFTIKAAELALALQKTTKADFLYQRAFSMETSLDLAKNITVSLIKANALEYALPYVRYIKAQEPENKYGARILETIDEILEAESDTLFLSNNAGALTKLATNYLLLGNKEKAHLYIGQALLRDPFNRAALEVKKKME